MADVPTSLAESFALVLSDLQETHPGLTRARSADFCDAACVCLARHHTPPTDMAVEADSGSRVHQIIWRMPDQRARDAHANDDDATRDGAYAIALRCVERELGLVAVKQARPKTGPDWILAPAGIARLPSGFVDLDDVQLFRLEACGTDHEPVGYLVERKRRQLIRGLSDLPGVVAVVRFDRPVARITDPIGVEG